MKTVVNSFTIMLSVILAFFTPTSIHAGDFDYTPKGYSLITASPTATQFFQFKDYPVDYFRGIPSITLPIYIIKCGAIEVPVNLCYQGGGIRTQQVRGNAGLGWSIICGAEIVHNVYGAPDDADQSGPRVHGLFHLNNDEKIFRNNLINKSANYKIKDANVYKNELKWEAIEGARYYQNVTDVANDTYSLYGLGLSADFAYTPDKNIIVSSESPLQIGYSNQIAPITDGGCDGLGYLVKDQKGLSYYFTSQDRSRYDYKYGNPEIKRLNDSIYYASAWHLDEIQDLCNNKVNLLVELIS